MNLSLLVVCLFAALPARAAQGEGGFPEFSAAVGDLDLKATAIGQGRPLETAAQPGGGVFDMRRCGPEDPKATPVYSSDFKWGYALPEMKARYEEMYTSGKRLGRRAFWNQKTGRLELPYDDGRGGAVVLPEQFVRSVIGHIEAASAASYIDAVFFPDMGHSHFLVPEKIWKDKLDSYPVERFSQLYTAMMSEPKLEVLYHTAEQLKTREEDGTLVTDARTQFRYQTRNIVGGNPGGLKVLQNPESRANTVGDVSGYFWWGAGFNLSASQDGCFAASVGGKTVRFDLSLFDLEPSPESMGGGDK